MVAEKQDENAKCFAATQGVVGEIPSKDPYIEKEGIQSSSFLPCKESPPVSKVQVFFLNISWFGMNVMYLILSVEVIPSQVHGLVGGEMKGQVLGAMVAGGAIVTFFISPLLGLKSDRLVSPFGRRRPLMVAGTVLLCISLFGMAFSAPETQSVS